jgi:HD-like signal output (HDOD) protein
MAHISLFLQSVKLPVMPEVAHALIRTLNDDDADVVTVRNVIAMDPTLTVTLLRMANSAIFGLSRSVNTLDSAVSIVGMSQIRARALSICMAHVFVMPEGLNRMVFWRASMACAGYAQWLAQQAGLDEQQAWLTGMMLRLGEITMVQRDATLVEHLEKEPCAAGERWQRERTLTGFDEGQVTAEIARRWDFPEEVVIALQGSAAPLSSSPMSPLAGIVHLASLLADTEHASIASLHQLPASVMQALNLNADALADTMPDAQSVSDISTLQS